MKRYSLIFTLLFLAATAYSQTTYRFTWAVSANDYTRYGFGAKAGYRFGPGVEFKNDHSPFSYGFDILFTSKGTSGYEGSMTQKYVQVPVNLGLHWSLSDKLDMVWNSSIFVAYAYGGLSKGRIENGVGWSSSIFTDDNIWGKKIPRFDVGYTTGFYLDTKRFIFGLGVEIGFVPLDSETYYDDYGEEKYDATLNMSGFISFGIKFWN